MSQPTQYKRHELSAIFGTMGHWEMKGLAADIAQNGLIHPITLWQGQVLDGWHRYQACLSAGVEPVFTEFEGDDEAALKRVFSLNAKRRHLSDAKRVELTKMATGWYANQAQSHRPKLSPSGEGLIGTTAQKVAEIAEVSVATVERHTTVERKAPALMPLVQAGKLPLLTAAKAATHAPVELLEKPSPEAVKAFVEAMTAGPRHKALELRRLTDQLATVATQLRHHANDPEVSGALSYSMWTLRSAFSGAPKENPSETNAGAELKHTHTHTQSK